MAGKHKASYDVIEVNHEQLKEELVDTLDSKVPLYIWGPPGIGKSVVTDTVAEETARKKTKFFVDWNRSSRDVKHAMLDPKGLPVAKLGLLEKDNPELAATFRKSKKAVKLSDCYIFADYRLSQRDPSDINGLPSISETADHVEWKPTLLFTVLSQPDADGLLFFDEIPQAMPVVQNAAYQLIQDRCCGEISFSDNIIVIAAGNRLTDGGNQFQIPPALANRFSHVELMSPTVDAWCDWAIDHDIDSRIVAFLRFKPSDLMDSMDDVRKKRAMAWASPRSWEKASDKIKTIKGSSNAVLNRIQRKVAQTVGVARSIEFRGFIKTTVNLDIKDILKNPEQVRGFDLSFKWALVSAVSEYYRADKKHLDDILGLCRKENLASDFAVSLLRMMRRHDRTKFATRLAKCKNKQVVLDFMKFFED
jgi:MoxR-like ATPase